MVDAATVVSYIAFALSVLIMIGAVQSGGAIFDTMNQTGFKLMGMSKDKVIDITTKIANTGPDEANYISLMLIIARIEAVVFLAMGLGSVYSLVLLTPGTKEVAVVHFIHGVFAICANMVHGQNFGLYSCFGPVDSNISQFYRDFSKAPFIMTGVLAVAFWSAFILCSS